MGRDAAAVTCTFRRRVPTSHATLGGFFAAFLRRGPPGLAARAAPLVDRLDHPVRDLVRGARREYERALGALPCLEDAVHERLGDDSPVGMDLRRFADAVTRRAPQFAVDVCGIGEDGTAIVGAYATAGTREVRPDDTVAGGALFTADLDRGTCRITVRAVRVLCTNGQTLPMRVLDGSPAYERHATGWIDGGIESTVRRAFSGEVLTRVTDLMAHATGVPVGDPIAFLRTQGAALDAPERARVVRAFLRHGDRTAYGALNALTETARDTADLRHRLSLERMAGRMILRFARLEARPTGREPQPR